MSKTKAKYIMLEPFEAAVLVEALQRLLKLHEHLKDKDGKVFEWGTRDSVLELKTRIEERLGGR